MKHFIEIIPAWDDDEGEYFIIMEWDEACDSGQLICAADSREEAIEIAREKADELGFELRGADVDPFDPEGAA